MCPSRCEHTRHSARLSGDGAGDEDDDDERPVGVPLKMKERSASPPLCRFIILNPRPLSVSLHPITFIPRGHFKALLFAISCVTRAEASSCGGDVNRITVLL